MISSPAKRRGRPPAKANTNSIKVNTSDNENNIVNELPPSLHTPPNSTILPEKESQSGSTPKRKKNPLGNLESNLNPKYIGNLSEKRSSKYRSNFTSPERSDSPFYLSKNLIGYVRKTTAHTKSPFSSPELVRKTLSFESPIDKLLRKNGASDAPTIALSKMSDDIKDDHNLNQLFVECKNEEFSLRGPAQESNYLRKIFEIKPECKTEQNAKRLDVSFQTMLKPQTQHDYNTMQPRKTLNFEEISNTNSNEISIDLDPPPASSIDYQRDDKSFDNSTTNLQMFQVQEGPFSNNVKSSNHSPSPFSVDSAKGSSLDTDLDAMNSIATGDIFWGQIFQFSYWPCMVCPDPEGKTMSVIENRGKAQFMIHVRFFADNGRRNWVKKENMLPYNGTEDYYERMKEAETKYGNKHPKYKAFVAAKGKIRLWYQAIKEADQVVAFPFGERVKRFLEIVKKSRVPNSNERGRNRMLNIHSSTPSNNNIDDSINKPFAQLKRRRSSSPVSPAFSPIAPSTPNKRRKLEQHNNEYSASDDLAFQSHQFKVFSDAMRSFVLENSTDSTLEALFMTNICNLWRLKHMTNSSTSISGDSTTNIKRLSERIRNISVLKKQSLKITTGKVQVQKNPNKPMDSKGRKIVRPIEEVVENILQLDNKYLFRYPSKTPVCKECLEPGEDLEKCSKECQFFVHPTCSGNLSASTTKNERQTPQNNKGTAPKIETSQDSNVICKDCISPKLINCCFVCKNGNKKMGELTQCSNSRCRKMFHIGCLKYWPQAKITTSSGKPESLLCPSHVCHTCVSDDPKGKVIHIEKSKLSKCIRCPATYHMNSACIPAGSLILSSTSVICPRHNKPQGSHINVNWCFICVAGGNLVCCESCPIAVHAECLKFPLGEEGYICEECETGRMPLYGEVVWAKFNHYRWWPSLILPPPEIPENLKRIAHNPLEFVIRFFGTNDHGWINRRRVYLYQEGDGSHPPKSQKTGLDQNYMKGVEEAKRFSELIKETKDALKISDAKQRISPPPYTKIKTNRPVPPIRLPTHDEVPSRCDCNITAQSPCGPNSNCINRVLFTECNPKYCPAGEQCQNQMFEKRIYPKLDVIYMNDKGFGLVCLEPISAGTFVIEYVGEIIDNAEFQRRITLKQQEHDENFYFLTLEKDYIIDAGPKGNLARFMNHSCDPNCETQKWMVDGHNRIGLFAIKDIPENSELTFNYYWDELLGNEKKNCHCGTDKCVGLIGGKYKESKLKYLQNKEKLKSESNSNPKEIASSQIQNLNTKHGKRTTKRQPTVESDAGSIQRQKTHHKNDMKTKSVKIVLKKKKQKKI